MGFLNFLAKFSFIGYGFNERSRGKKIAAQQYGHVMKEKEAMEKELDDKIVPVSKELTQEINSHKSMLAARPKVNGVDDFLDDRGLKPSQVRAKQMNVLKTVDKYDQMLDTEIEHLAAGLYVRGEWCERLDCSVVIKKKKVSKAEIDSICNSLQGVNSNDLFSAVSNGGKLKETYVFNDAQIIVNALAAHNISAKAVSVKAQSDVNRDSVERNPERDLPKVAKVQRFVLAGIWVIGLLLLDLIVNGSIGFFNNSLIGTLIFIAAGALVIILVHWLLSKPLVALATKLVGWIFKKGGDATKDSATFLRGIFLSDIFDNGLDALDDGLIDYLDGMQANYKTYRNWALSFMQARVLDGLLYEVIDQMTSGATYNSAINSAEAKIDRQKAAKKQEERMQAMEQENKRHNLEMEKQARKRTEYERQRAANAAAAAQAQREFAAAQKETAKAEKKQADELEKIRRGW